MAEKNKVSKIRVNIVKDMHLPKQKVKIWLPVLLISLAVGLFLIFNAGYFWKQINYRLHKNTNIEQNILEQPVRAKGEPDLLTIPSLQISTPIIYVSEASEKAYQEALVNGVVHFPGTAVPGQSGNVYIFGHSSDYLWSKGKYKTVFALLPSIEMGSVVQISDSEGNVFQYKVIKKFVVSPKDTSVLQQDPTKQLLTLQTSYPIGTALQRYIVVTELIK